jgi:hypothetical protein
LCNGGLTSVHLTYVFGRFAKLAAMNYFAGCWDLPSWRFCNLHGRQLQLSRVASTIFPVESRDFLLATSAVLKNGRYKMPERPLRNIYLALWAPLLDFQKILGLTFTKTLMQQLLGQIHKNILKRPRGRWYKNLKRPCKCRKIF